MKNTSIILAAFAIGAIFTSSAQAQTYTLRYTPKKGAHYSYKTNMDMQQNISAMGQEISFDIDMDMKMMLDVADVSSGVNDMNISFKDSKVQLSGMGGLGGKDTTMNMDMIDNMKLNFKTNERGTLISTEKADLKNAADPMMSQLGDRINQLTNVFSFEYPEKPLKKGDTWTVSKKDTNSSNEGALITSITTVYTFDGIKDTLGVKCARIHTKSTAMTIEGNIKQMGMDMAMDADGTTSGTSYIELANGMPVASKVSTQMDMRMAITGQENMIIPMQTDMKMIMTRIK